MSSPAVNIATPDLTHLWPEQDVITKSQIREAGAGYTCQTFDPQANGFIAELKFGKSKRTQRIIIPRQYKNRLRFLNFKIACYRAALELAWLELDFSTADPENENGAKALMGLDSLARNIVFHSGVRRQFFHEIEGNHIRSPAMDSWLLREYRDKIHDPKTVEKSAALPQNEDPLKYGM
jgi:hypothetical protein